MRRTLGDLCENPLPRRRMRAVSDFSAIDGSIVYADSFRVVVTPGGNVHALATYPCWSARLLVTGPKRYRMGS
jgi:hypothetical protein